VPPTPPRERDPAAKRIRIADAALELFQRQGYAETTIEQIAAAARVGRRTVFDHFPTKEAILFGHLAVRREVLIARLRERPTDEPPLVSLHAILREQCVEGYDRALLDQIRRVIAAEPKLAVQHLTIGMGSFERTVIETLEARPGAPRGSFEVHALTEMAFAWFITAVRIYLKNRRRSLVRCFDEVVATCVEAGAALHQVGSAAGAPNR